MKIMVLDDNAQILSMLVTMLHNAYGTDNCEVVSGRNGQEGLALLEADSAPDLILTNLRMPMMDGLKFLREVRHNTVWDSIPLVLMSAVSPADVLKEASEEGAEAFLRKPFNYRDLTTMINHLLAS